MGEGVEIIDSKEHFVRIRCARCGHWHFLDVEPVRYIQHKKEGLICEECDGKAAV